MWKLVRGLQWQGGVATPARQRPLFSEGWGGGWGGGGHELLRSNRWTGDLVQQQQRDGGRCPRHPPRLAGSCCHPALILHSSHSSTFFQTHTLLKVKLCLPSQIATQHRSPSSACLTYRILHFYPAIHFASITPTFLKVLQLIELTYL